MVVYTMVVSAATALKADLGSGMSLVAGSVDMDVVSAIRATVAVQVCDAGQAPEERLRALPSRPELPRDLGRCGQRSANPYYIYKGISL